MGELIRTSAQEAECTPEGAKHVEELQNVFNAASMRGQLGEQELIRATQEYMKAKHCIEVNASTSADVLHILTLGANAHYGNAVIEEAIGAQTLLNLSTEGAIQVDVWLTSALSERAAKRTSDTIYVQRGSDGVFHRVSWYEMTKREVQQGFGSLPEEPIPVIEGPIIIVPKLTAQAEKRVKRFEATEKIITADRK